MNSLSRVVASLAGLAMAITLLTAPASAQYTRKDLITDTGRGGTLTDPNLKNAWGLVSTATSPFWIGDNVTGKSSLYAIVNGAGGVSATINALVVTVPSVTPGQPGSPTGVVANPATGTSTDFSVSALVNGQQKTARAPFIFATLDGTISGWSPSVNATVAIIAKDRSGVGASYTGLAVANSGGHNYLYAADGGPNRRVDVFDASFNLHSFSPDAFVDPNIPQKFTTYGIQTICQGADCNIWVTYTALGAAQSGFVSEFTTDGTLVRSFALNGPMHSPWGIALAPDNFGPMSGALLVSNNTSRGRIDAYNIATGEFLGALRDENGKVILIDQLWGIRFGNGGSNGHPNQLFFTAGSEEYQDGAFGVITFNQ